MTSLDETVLQTIHGWSSPELDAWFGFATQLGGFEFVLIFMAFLMIGLIRYRLHKAAGLLALGVGGAALINQILKSTFERTRPDLWEQIVVETSYSFPSGHAMVSLALAASLVALVWRTRWRPAAIVTATIYVVIIGLSRLYLGVHYPSDVLAGWLFSGLWVAAAVYLASRLTK